jgi:hypothetical protein
MKRKALSKQIRVQVLARDNYRCRMCGRSSREVALEVDHIIPVASGGTDELSNLATLCRDCNAGKSNYHFADYTQIALIPNDLEDHFKFLEVDSLGDYREFHLYCYFKTSIHAGHPDDKFHHKWRINRSEFPSSSNPEAMIDRRRTEETKKFSEFIRRKLIEERSRLIMTEEGLVKV